MTIYTVQFDYPPPAPKYSTLLKVFEASVKKYQPSCRFVTDMISPPENPMAGKKADNFWYNSEKLRLWVDFLEKTDDDVILADCDMLMISPADRAFDEYDFDVGYTARSEIGRASSQAIINYWGVPTIDRMPMNGGVMFARNTPEAFDFYRQLYETNMRMWHDFGLHTKWNLKYAGMNQAAFGCLFETGEYAAKVQALPCRIWNAVDSDWGLFNDTTVFVHMKSKLRKMVLRCEPPIGKFKYAMDRWYEIAEEIGAPAFMR